MTEPTIRDDAREARHRLSVPAGGPNGMSRRTFLQALGVGTGAAIGTAALLRNLEGFAVGATTDDDGILVLVMLEGGNDGLNTVIPYTNSSYRALRPRIRFDPPGGANPALSIGDSAWGFHPALAGLAQRYRAGQVAVVHGVGYQPPDLSHFSSMGYWMMGWQDAPPKAYTNGWVGRYLDTLPGAGTNELLAACVGQTVPLHMVGSTARAAGLPQSIDGAFGVDPDDPNDDPSDSYVLAKLNEFGTGATGLGTWGDAYAKSMAGVLSLIGRVKPAYATANDSPSDLVRQLTLTARLINTGLGTRVYNTSLGGFDTHTDQPATHAELLTELDQGIAAFYAALSPTYADRVTILTFSEFGRRPEDNDGAGTDHGTAAVNLLVGTRVAGGMHGTAPGLTSGALDANGNLKPTVDFRNVYADVLRDWMGVATPQNIVGKTYPSLGLFRAGPSAPTTTTTTTLPRPPLVHRTRRVRTKTG